MKTLSNHRYTIKNPIGLKSIGLHSGRTFTIKMYSSDNGITINGLQATIDNASSPGYSTRLGNVDTIEHLMAALFLYRVTDVDVTVEPEDPNDASMTLEVPILDGSSRHYCRALENNLVDLGETNESLMVKDIIDSVKGLHVSNGDKKIFIRHQDASPDAFIINYTFRRYGVTKKIKFILDETNRSSYGLMRPKDIMKPLTFYKTFCFEDQLDSMKARGLGRGGNHNNVLVLKKNYTPLKSNNKDTRHDEFLLHKILDFLGDISLLGVNNDYSGLEVDLVASGHQLNLEFARRIRSINSQD